MQDAEPQQTQNSAAKAAELTATTDEQLVAITLGGNRQAFDTLIQRYQRQAMAVSYRLLGNTQDAMEVTQDAFLKAFSSLPTLQTPAAFGGWLMRIVSNLSLNYRRSRKTRTQLPLADALGAATQDDATPGSEWMSRDADPLHRAESVELGAQLSKALMQLPEKQRTAIILFTIEQLPQKEVAELLHCSVEAVKWHVFQGRKRLKDLLKDYL